MSEESSLAVDYAEFFGTKINSNSSEVIVQTCGIHIVMACIDINEEMIKQEHNSPKAALWIEKGDVRYQVCELSQGWRQQPLNLFFEKKLRVRFSVVGNASIYIYGYHLKSTEEDDCLREEDEDHSSPAPNNSPLGKYCHIIDTTCYTISDDDGSNQDSASSFVSSTSNSSFGYTTESTPRSASLGSSTSNESPAGSKKKVL